MRSGITHNIWNPHQRISLNLTDFSICLELSRFMNSGQISQRILSLGTSNERGTPRAGGGLRLGNRIRETLRVIPDRNGIQTSTESYSRPTKLGQQRARVYYCKKKLQPRSHTFPQPYPVSSLHVDAGRGRLYLSDKAMEFYTSLCFRCYIYIRLCNIRPRGWQDSHYASAPGRFGKNKHIGDTKRFLP